MTRNERLYSLLTDIDERWIAEAAPRVARRSSRGRWIRWVSVAACLVLLVGVMLAWDHEHSVTPPIDPDAPDQPTSPDVPIEPDDPYFGELVVSHQCFTEIIDHYPWDIIYPRNGFDDYILVSAKCIHPHEDLEESHGRGYIDSIWINNKENSDDVEFNSIQITISDTAQEMPRVQEALLESYLNGRYVLAEELSLRTIEDNTIINTSGEMYPNVLVSEYIEPDAASKRVYEQRVYFGVIYDGFVITFHYVGEKIDAQAIYNIVISCPFFENIE